MNNNKYVGQSDTCTSSCLGWVLNDTTTKTFVQVHKVNYSYLYKCKPCAKHYHTHSQLLKQ